MSLDEMRQEAIKRLSVAMDIPEEMLDAEGYHWAYGYQDDE